MTTTTAIAPMTAAEALDTLKGLATDGMMSAAILSYDRRELEALTNNMLAAVESLAKCAQAAISAGHLAQPSPTAFDAETEPLRIGDHVTDLDESETGIVIAVDTHGDPAVAWPTWYGDTMVRGSVLLEAWSRLPLKEKNRAKAIASLERRGIPPGHQNAAHVPENA